MGYTLSNVVPWGRGFEEYVRFFSLQESDLEKKILSCADGPSGFNAGMTSRGKYCISFDPIYQFSKQEIESRIEETAEIVMKELY